MMNDDGCMEQIGPLSVQMIDHDKIFLKNINSISKSVICPIFFENKISVANLI